MRRRMIVLFALAMMAVILVLSASVSEAKKKGRHKHSPKTPVVIQCPTLQDGFTCVGNNGSNLLLDQPNKFDQIFGEGGNDVYVTRGDADFLIDSNTISSDYYLVATNTPSTASFVLTIEDVGGTLDTLDVSGFFKSTDVQFRKIDANNDGQVDDLYMFYKPASNSVSDISINKFFSTNSIDSFKFSDTTLTADQIKSMAVTPAASAAKAQDAGAGETATSNPALAH